jgi:predicted enzyme related to lactoylglutathione lyase
MVRGIDSILIGSSKAGELAKFYQEVIGLEEPEEFEIGDENERGFIFHVGNMDLTIMDHSEVKGKNSGPERIMINFEVDNIEKEMTRIKKEGVNVKQDIYHIEGYGYVATLVDLDGNFFQFVQVRESN